MAALRKLGQKSPIDHDENAKVTLLFVFRKRNLSATGV